MCTTVPQVGQLTPATTPRAHVGATDEYFGQHRRLCNTWLMVEQDKANRARVAGILIAIAAVLAVLAWKTLVH
ncbi:MAG TPA: hypothetical protein VMU80_04605 [Bryobacteraceae bacterium]|nr:hypothetical protein [Bryobacteraceae bacterium]